MAHSESEEMYLKTICRLGETRECVRAMHIVEELGYTKGAVSLVLKRLAQKGYIEVDELGGIRLTPVGEQNADEVCERGQLLTAFLMKIGAHETLAKEEACRMEHVVSRELMDAVREFLEQDRSEKT